MHSRGRAESMECALQLSPAVKFLDDPGCIAHYTCHYLGMRGNCCPGDDALTRCCCPREF